MSASDRNERLCRDFDRRAPHLREALSKAFDAEVARTVVREARNEFAGLAPEIPYAGNEKNPMLSQIVGPAQLLACALCLKRRGFSPEQIGAFIGFFVQGFADRWSWVPNSLIRLAIPLVRPLLLGRFRREAAASQRRDDPGEFIYEVVVEPTTTVGLNMTRCAVCTLFARHDAMDVMPYICAGDDQLSDTLGLGLRRTGTLALGAEHCDFRYRPGGESRRLRDHYDLTGVSE